MKWNCIEGRLSLKLLLMIAMLNAFSAESCCQRPIYAYENGDAVPPECKPTDRCTEASIFADRARSGEAVHSFLISLKKSNTITLIGNTTTYNLDILEEVIHKGLGPAITLQNVVLSRGSFKKLKTIKVDDVSIYCDGTTDLIKIEGSIPQPILDRLQKVKNETLEACKSLTTTQPSVLVATQEACVPNSNLQKVVENVEKECSNNDLALYIASLSSGILLILWIATIVFSVQMYRKLRSNQKRIFSTEAPPGIQTAEESAPEAQKDRKIAGVDLSIRRHGINRSQSICTKFASAASERMGNSGRQKGKDVLQLKKIDTKKPKEDKKVAGEKKEKESEAKENEKKKFQETSKEKN